MGDLAKFEPERDSDSDGRSSPDAKCSICLGKLDAKSSTENCFHFFCFKCLLKWAQIKPECPLCKQPFKLIYYNFKDTGVFERMEVPPPLPESNELIHTTQLNYNIIIDMLETQYGNFGNGFIINQRSLSPAARYLMAGLSSAHRRRAMQRTQFRTSIYMRNLYINGFFGDPHPPRESSPSYYIANPSQLDRLRPWLMRELQAIGNTGATTMLYRLLSALRRVHITSSHFRFLLLQCVESRFVDHFIHEFRIFATSVYDVIGFDENARYPLPPLAPTHHIDLDSDVEVIHESFASSGTSEDSTTTTASTSSSIVISDNESDVEVIEVRRRSPRSTVNPVRITAEVYVISSEDELPSTSASHRSRRSNQSSGRSGMAGPSSSASRPDIPSITRKRKRKHRKTFKRISMLSDTSSNDETDYAERIPHGRSSRRNARVSGLENGMINNNCESNTSEQVLSIIGDSESNTMRRNPVHYRHKKMKLVKKRLDRSRQRQSRRDESSSDENESLANCAARSHLQKRLRSCVIVPATATPTLNDSD